MKKLKSLFLLPALLIAGLTGCSSEPSDEELLQIFSTSNGLLLNADGDPVYSDKTTYASFKSSFLGLQYQKYEGKEVNVTWTSDAPADKQTKFIEDTSWTEEKGPKQVTIVPWYGYHAGDDYSFKLTATIKIGELSAKTEFKFNAGKASVSQTTLKDLNKSFTNGTTKKGLYELSGIITATYDDPKKGIFIGDGIYGLTVSGGVLSKDYNAETMPIGTKVKMIGNASRANNSYRFTPEVLSVDADAEIETPVGVTINKEADLAHDNLKPMQGRIITAEGLTFVGKETGSSSKYDFKYGKTVFMIRISNTSSANKSAIETKLSSLTVDNTYDITFALRWDKDSKGEFPFGVFVASEGKSVVDSIIEQVN